MKGLGDGKVSKSELRDYFPHQLISLGSRSRTVSKLQDLIEAAKFKLEDLSRTELLIRYLKAVDLSTDQHGWTYFKSRQLERCPGVPQADLKLGISSGAVNICVWKEKSKEDKKAIREISFSHIRLLER